MIKIVIECETLAEARQTLDSLGSEAPLYSQPETKSAEPEQSQEPAESTPAEKSKPGKKAGKKKASKKKSGKKSTEKVESDTPTKDEVRDHLAKVGKELGFEAVQQICLGLGATGLRDLAEEHYADAIAECKKQLDEE